MRWARSYRRLRSASGYDCEAECKGGDALKNYECVDKLPLWAQRRISKLEGDVEYYKEKAFTVTSKKGTSIQVGRHSGDAAKFLPEETHVTFFVGDRRSIEVCQTRDKDGIYISTEGGYLSFFPNASNVGVVKVPER